MPHACPDPRLLLRAWRLTVPRAAATLVLAVLWLGMGTWDAIAPPARAQGFADQVWSYDSYQDRHPDQAERIAAFQTIVAGQAPPRPPRDSANQPPVAITVVYPGNQISDYWRRSLASMEERLREAGLPYRLNTLFTAAGTEIRAQEAFIAQALENPPDYLVFTLDALRHKAIIEPALGNTRTRLILQNITTPLKAWEGVQPFLYVGFDHQVGTQMLARHLIDRTGGRGHYAVLFGPPGYVSQMRGDSFIRTVSQDSDLKMITSYYVGFDRDKARRATLRILDQHPDIAFLYACSTDIALGAVDALRARGRVGQVLVNGWGGGQEELDALASGALDATVMRINDDNGVAMADAIVLDQSGQGDRVPTVYSGDIALVTRQTPREVLEALTTRAFRYSQGMERRP